MGKGLHIGLMAKNMMASTWMIKSMVTECFNGKMVENMKENGYMGNRMAKER